MTWGMKDEPGVSAEAAEAVPQLRLRVCILRFSFQTCFLIALNSLISLVLISLLLIASPGG